MKSIILMFGGGLVGGMIGPVDALIGAAAGFFIGRHVPGPLPEIPPSAQTGDCRPGKHKQGKSCPGRV
jgi:hypothetical protein